MAGEFGIATDEVMTLLRQMEVSVRGPASVLSDDQVSRIRARWEREKRSRADKQNAPAPSARRRKTADGAAGPRGATGSGATGTAGGATTAKPAKTSKPAKVTAKAAAAAAAAAQVAESAAPGVRRRKRADLAPAIEEAPVQAEIAIE